MIQVLVVAEGQVRDHLESTVTAEQDMQLTGVADTFPKALTLIRDNQVVLASTDIADDGAYQLSWTVSRKDICAPVLVIQPNEHPTDVIRYYEAGARGFVHGLRHKGCMVHSIRRVWRGEVVIDERWLPALLTRLAEMADWMDDFRTPNAVEASLTRREREVLLLIGRNFTNQDIANHLIIEVGTVKNHVHNILAKLNVSSRGEAAAYVHLFRERNRSSRQNRISDGMGRFLT